MNVETFNIVVEDACHSIKKVLVKKGEEYGFGGDRLYNFKRAAAALNCSPKMALLGMMMKHVVSVIDLVEDKLTNNVENVEEKIGDNINYLILLKALLQEERGVGNEKVVE